MDANTEINRVAIVETGLIGSSWAACFLAHDLDVVATDPAPGTEDKVRPQRAVCSTASGSTVRADVDTLRQPESHGFR